MDLNERVYFYMPDDLAKNQTNRGKYNCAEAIYRAIIDKYELKVSDDAKVLMVAFGGGMFMGDVCGLLIGGYAGLASMYANKTAPSANDVLKEACREWYKRFNNLFDTVDCIKMRPTTGGCSNYGRLAGKLFEQMIKDLETIKSLEV